MTKTKVRISPSLLDYCQVMTEWANEARDEKLRVSTTNFKVESFPLRKDISVSMQAGLLTPPQIVMLGPELEVRNGETDGLILINTSDEFGIEYIYVTLRDEAGNLLEYGYAMFTGCEGHWGYIPCEPLTAGMVVIVRAVAVDTLGGMGVAYEKCTVQEASA